MNKLAKPEDRSGRLFEAWCLLIFERHFNALDANYFGQNSTGQMGIDIALTTLLEGREERILVQCKDVDSFYYSTVRQDLKSAIRYFGKRLQSDPGRRYFFIAATTADGANKADIKEKAERLIAKALQNDASRFRFEVFDWDKLHNIIDGNEHLRSVFFRPRRQADLEPKNSTLTACAAIARYVASNQLAAARKELRSLASGTEDFQTIPSAGFDGLLTLFMKAGDFHRANRLLDVVLGAFPYEAKYLLAYLRALRVLQMFPRSDYRPSGRGVWPDRSMRDLPHEVDALADRLHRAFGGLDEQLTLALWTVTYASAKSVANDGLRRAIGLVVEGWPRTSRPLRSDRQYRVSKDGTLEVDGTAGWEPNTLGEERDDTALVMVYMYIRHTHQVRFGIDETCKLERGHGGSPAAISGLPIPRPGEPFQLGFTDYLKSDVCRYFPNFFAEWMGRDRLWAPPRMVSPVYGLTLNDSQYVCSVEMLLKDCIEYCVRARFNEFWGVAQYAPTRHLLTSNLTLEELARAYAGLLLYVDVLVLYVHDRESVLCEFATLQERLVRIHVGGAGGGVLQAHATYFDFSTGGAVSEFDAAIALAIAKNAVLVCVTLKELEQAKTLLPDKKLQPSYWHPILR